MYKRYLKRVFDICVCLIFLIPLLVIISLVAVFVRITLGSPVFFTQERPGKNGKIFLLYKFRTMTDARDERGALLPNSERLTPLGRFLRSTSLDELPEIYNVLRGDMSLVGPRPLLVEYLQYYDEQQKRRHEVLPGITGLAQVNGRNGLSWEQKFAFDVAYVDNITFLLDLKILLKTGSRVLLRDGINASEQETMPRFTGSKDGPEENESRNSDKQ